MRSYFVIEVVRCAFSYGCYQMEVFQGLSESIPFVPFVPRTTVADIFPAVLKNFLHLRNAIAGRKMALASFVTGERLGLF